MIYLLLFVLAFLCGVLGRMGGASGYNTKYRDWGCPVVIVAALYLLYGWHPWVYASIFLLTWGALSTYWQKLFHGVDNLWFSGLVTGLALYPIVFIDSTLFSFVIMRALLLCIIWGCLNKYLPQKVFIWGRDVVEEFLRYFCLI